MRVHVAQVPHASDFGVVSRTWVQRFGVGQFSACAVAMRRRRLPTPAGRRRSGWAAATALDRPRQQADQPPMTDDVSKRHKAFDRRIGITSRRSPLFLSCPSSFASSLCPCRRRRAATRSRASSSAASAARGGGVDIRRLPWRTPRRVAARRQPGVLDARGGRLLRSSRKDRRDRPEETPRGCRSQYSVGPCPAAKYSV